MSRKMISFISPCFNEEENVEELYERVCRAMEPFANYDLEYIFIDNASTDGTVAKLKSLAAHDRRLKIIVNTRNFGHIRSPYWGILQTKGDATIYLASDLQDPPEMIGEFIKSWEEGYKVVLATKPVSKTNPITHFLRKSYYHILDKISDVTHIKNATGFGLYDKTVLDQIRLIEDPYPYFRGLIRELGYEVKCIPFSQPRRLRGISKNNFYSLYDIALLGVVSHSLVPLRMATLGGFVLSAVSFCIAVVYLVKKLLAWDSYAIGMAPLIIGLFFVSGIILFFLGVLGEYIGAILTYVQKRPIVVEKERINFE